VTGLAKHVPLARLKEMGNVGDGAPVIDPQSDMKSIPQGAATQLWCAVSSQLNDLGGVFCANSDIASVEENSVAQTLEGRGRSTSRVAPYAIDEAAAVRLWAISEKMTGLSH
jgi:hypothetical protein